MVIPLVLLLLPLLWLLLWLCRDCCCFVVLNEVKWQARKDQHSFFFWLQRMVKKKASELYNRKKKLNDERTEWNIHEAEKQRININKAVGCHVAVKILTGNSVPHVCQLQCVCIENFQTFSTFSLCECRDFAQISLARLMFFPAKRCFAWIVNTF